MKQAELAVYNFLAGKIESPQYQTVSSLKEAIDSGAADKRCIAHLFYHVYNIDTKEVIASVWKARNGFEWLKTANDKVVEHYRRITKGGRFCVSLDLETGEHIEYYILEGLDLVKYDTVTNLRLGHTTDSEFDGLPLEYKDALTNFNYKSYILYYATKPYGRVVGVTADPLEGL